MYMIFLQHVLQASGHINSLLNASVSWCHAWVYWLKPGFLGMNRLVGLIHWSKSYFPPMVIVYLGSFFAGMFGNLLSLDVNIFWRAGERTNWCDNLFCQPFMDVAVLIPNLDSSLLGYFFIQLHLGFCSFLMDKTIVSFFQTYLWGRGGPLDTVNLFSSKVIHWKLSTCRMF